MTLRICQKFENWWFWPFGHFWDRGCRKLSKTTFRFGRYAQKCQNWRFLAFLAQKASKVIISLFSGFWDSSMKMRGSSWAKGGTQSWPGTAIVNHPLRLQYCRGLSYFPYIFYFVNFTISAAIRQGLFGSFENVIKEFPKFDDFRKFFNFLRGFLTFGIDQKLTVLRCWFWSS